MFVRSFVFGAFGLFGWLLVFGPGGQIPVHLLRGDVDTVVHLLAQPHFLLGQGQHALMQDGNLSEKFADVGLGPVRGLGLVLL